MVTALLSSRMANRASPLVVVLLALVLAGCHSAPLAGSGADLGSAAVATRSLSERALSERALSERALSERAAPDPTEATWIRTKLDYERTRAADVRWTRTADAAPGGEGGGGEDLAKAAQNPIASMISVPFQNNTSFGIGPNDRTQNVLNIQPVIPFSLGGGWNVVNRLIIPVIHQPNPATTADGWDGLGDINLTSFLVAPPIGNLMVGVGPIIVFPTATSPRVGNQAWGAGPSAVVVWTSGKWVVGALVSNTWGLESPESVGNLQGGEDEANTFLVQYFVNFNLPNGWYLSSAPINTADWNAPSDDRWIVPLGGGVGKVFTVGKQPINTSLQAYYNVITPDNGPEWSMRFQVTLLFPK